VKKEKEVQIGRTPKKEGGEKKRRNGFMVSSLLFLLVYSVVIK